MSRHKTLLGFAGVAGLLLGATLALADDVSPSPPPMPGPRFCRENPGKCEEARARREAFCQENPQKCEQMKQKRAKRHAFCQENPEKCDEQRAQMKARRCDEMKQQMRERVQQRHGSAPEPAP